MEMSKTQIDKLGDRLKADKLTEPDLRLLSDYRLSFAACHETVIAKLRDDLGLEPTGRPSKTTPSIVDKLRRESIRLSQVQDIAGCRLIVRDIKEQEHIVVRVASLFDDVRIVDRRETPSHGYRAVHVVVKCDGKLIEVQVRTELQQVWAQLCEKFADKYGQSLKYGQGDIALRKLLTDVSQLMANMKSREIQVNGMLLNLTKSDKTTLESHSEIDRRTKNVMQLKEGFDQDRLEIIQKVRDLLQNFGS